MTIRWPEGKSFAFSIFDDTDLSVPGNYERVYDLLGDVGMRTTKSVWPLGREGQPVRGPEGSTCDDAEYLTHVLSLQRAGFEIGYHNSSHSGGPREHIRRALDRFRDLFGSYPSCMSNHQNCPEAIHWGPARLSLPLRAAYRLATRRILGAPQQGHLAQSQYFWGDMCFDRIKYVRNWVFNDIDTLRACPSMPYHDPARPYVKAWFASTNASWLDDFLKCMTEERQDELEASGGACILYTHFGTNFQTGATVDTRFTNQIRRLSRKSGWFVPVSQLLDHIASQRGIEQLNQLERQRLEWKWFSRKLLQGATE